MEFMRRPARESDKRFVRCANRQAYEDVVTRQFGKWDDAFHKVLFEKKWERGEFEVVEGSSGRVGAVWVTDEGDHLWLREIFLVPDHQGQGIGSELVRQELQRARDLDKPLRLCVLRENRALELYERLGLSVCGETDTHFWMEVV